MNLPLYIAWRYLFARKRAGVVNLISAVSAAGLAVGTTALVLILSVYNGFNRIIDDNLGQFDPDIRVCRADGDYFRESDLELSLADSSLVLNAGASLEFDAFLSYGERQSAAHILGSSDSVLLKKGELDLAAVGASLAARTGISPRFLAPIRLYSPDRSSRISITGPESSLLSAEVYPDRIINVNSEINESLVMIPIGTARALFGIDGMCSSLDIRLLDSSDETVRKFIEGTDAGEEFVLKDRYAQHKDLYRMMSLEKAAVYGVLLLVALIVALNIFSCLSMLRIEKEYDMGSLRSLGADEKSIRRIFACEGCLISAAGIIPGLVLGIALTLLQQHFGIIRLPGNMLSEAYPVVLKARDVILSTAGVSAISLIVSLAASRLTR